MKKLIYPLLAMIILASCSAQPTPTVKPVDTLAPTNASSPTAAQISATATTAFTATPQATATSLPPTAAVIPTQGYGPTNFPPGVDPLTGQSVTNPALLERRPLLIKVTNLPRESRPQWGLSQADLVYEYYTELGSTRFAALFYGQDATQVGPIRSARFFDENLISMYKAVFAFGSAYDKVYQELFSQPYANRLILEGPAPCPPMCRFEPSGANYLITNTSELSKYATEKGINQKPSLDGMFFQTQAPADGQPLNQVFTRFSGAIYNRWDYDAASGRYLRFVDTQDDVDRTNEVYVQLVDKNNNKPIAANNLVVLFMQYQYYVKTATSEVFKMNFTGSGTAYAFRDGKAFQLKWVRNNPLDVVTLTNADGTPYAFKPGNTWFEVMGASTGLVKQTGNWRFNFAVP